VHSYITRLVRLAAVPLLLAGMVGGAAASAPAAWAAGAPRLAGLYSAAAEAARVSVSAGVKQVVGNDEGYCALFTSGRVDCWGYGLDGELGDGLYSESATPVVVVGVSGTGALTSVASLGSDGQGICAVLTSGGVDCWGYGGDGELGNGSYADSAIPVKVKGLGGSGTLTGVASLASFRGFPSSTSYCALLTSGHVDCWGFGPYGQLGNGVFYTTGNEGSDVPVAVKAVGGAGTLTGVSSLDTMSTGAGVTSYCAVLVTGGADCWGDGTYGQLGDGKLYTTGNQGSDVPVKVKGTGGSGTLTGAASLTDGFLAFCAVLTSGGVDCWGAEDDGQLGNGALSGQTAVPVKVKSVGGSGTLTGVSSLTTQDTESFCALLTSGRVDCWGSQSGGTGSEPSTVPVKVKGLGGSGTLAGVASLASTSGIFPTATYCAVLTSGGADCWGDGGDGQLGNGSYGGTSGASTVPVKVKGVGGSGTLAGVVTVRGSLADANFCAIVQSGAVDCWGYGQEGELGNGAASNSDVPVAAAFP
jgi:alpha-tubulin suppressor-like RCC1 family protein